MEIYKDLTNPASQEFEKLLNSQLSKVQIEEGKIIEGKINKITDKFVFIFVEGLKSEPVLDINELKSLLKKLFPIDGRGGETRTHDLRFWRPSLYQLSYTPKIVGAGEGNRTLVTSLEGWGFTTKLHPQQKNKKSST